MLGGDMAAFAARLSIGRWATFWRRSGAPIGRQCARLEYLITIVAVDENVENGCRLDGNPPFPFLDRIVLHLYECTNEMVLSTKKAR
jgi:hypothetical protein